MYKKQRFQRNNTASFARQNIGFRKIKDRFLQDKT